MAVLAYVLLTLVLVISACAGNYDYNNASLLEDALFLNYHVNVRPEETVQVWIELSPYHLNFLDIVEQASSITGFLTLTWTDPRLSWNPSNYGNISELQVPIGSVWTPPVILVNSAVEPEILRDNMKSMPMLLLHSGAVDWRMPVTFHASCQMDVTFYPFDKQTCHYTLAAWQHDTSALLLKNNQPVMSLTSYSENGEWAIDDTRTEISTLNIYSIEWSTVTFTVQVSRKDAYYVINILLPVWILDLLGILVFTLPEASGEKIGFSLSNLLSLAVVLTLVADKIPTTSLNTSVLSVSMLVCFLAASLEVLLTVMVLRLHHCEESCRVVSPSLQTLTRKVLAPLSGWKKPPSASVPVESDRNRTTVQPIASSTEKQDAWTDGTEPQNSKDEFEYSFREIAAMVDKICFVGFLCMSGLATFIFVMILSLGAGNH